MIYVQWQHYNNIAPSLNAISMLFKALLPVCMKYTAQSESQVAQGEAECYIYLS